MDFVSTLLVTLSEPKGFWQSILYAFRNGLGTYILAVILIAILVRLLFSFVDVFSKKTSMKTMELNAKMKPELDAIKQRYGNDPNMLNQKTKEIYNKYQFNMMGSCFPMLITMILQFTVFLTLWNGLQSVSNFNITNQYQEMKNIYANVLALNENQQLVSDFQEEDTLSVELVTNEDGTKNLVVKLLHEDGTESLPINVDFVANKAERNKNVYNNLIVPYALEVEGQKTLTSLEKQIVSAAETLTDKYYADTQESFLWIKNVYKAESPSSPMLTEDQIKSYIQKYYDDQDRAEEAEVDAQGNAIDYEGKIYQFVTKGIDKGGHNGYYILTILAVATSLLSIVLNNLLSRRKDGPQQKQSWAMYVIMPVIIGIFTFMYTSLFAIYLIVGQLMMIVLTPLTTWIVKKWTETDAKKKKDKNVIEVDYRRK